MEDTSTNPIDADEVTGNEGEATPSEPTPFVAATPPDLATATIMLAEIVGRLVTLFEKTLATLQASVEQAIQQAPAPTKKRGRKPGRKAKGKRK